MSEVFTQPIRTSIVVAKVGLHGIVRKYDVESGAEPLCLLIS